MGSQPWLPGLVFQLLLFLSAYATAQSPAPPFDCRDNLINYTSNSIYDANLNSALSSVSLNIDDSGFYNASVGESPDRANVIALCRGDIQLDRCRGCVNVATTELVRQCPNQKQGIIFYEFCLLRFSNASIFGTFASSPMYFLYNVVNATSPDQFVQDRRVLIDNLRGVAAGCGSRRKVAYGTRNTSDNETLYAIVQCSPDLFSDDCASCLNELERTQRVYCGHRVGCRALGPSCNFRYETLPFYNETRLRELLDTPSKALPPSPSPPPPRGKREDISSRTIIIIVASVVACLIIAVCVDIRLTKRIKQQPRESLETQDILTAKSLQYDFGEIKAATDDFSRANKLGEDQLGTIYRGKLPNGQEIAVKRLFTNSGQDDEEFKTEVMLVVKLQHVNLVRLLGFCIEGKEKLLVYEFIEYASLNQQTNISTTRLSVATETRGNAASVDRA